MYYPIIANYLCNVTNDESKAGVGKLFGLVGRMSPRQACRGPEWK